MIHVENRLHPGYFTMTDEKQDVAGIGRCYWHVRDVERLFPIRILSDDNEFNVSHAPSGAWIGSPEDPGDIECAIVMVEALLDYLGEHAEVLRALRLGNVEACRETMGETHRGGPAPDLLAARPRGGQGMSDQDLQEVARGLDQIFNGDLKGTDRTTGWCLITFGFNAPGIGNYVSNASRPDMITALRELADQLEAGQTNERFPFKER